MNETLTTIAVENTAEQMIAQAPQNTSAAQALSETQLLLVGGGTAGVVFV